MRSSTKQMVMAVFHKEDKPYTIKDLSEITGLNRKTVTAKIAELESDGFLRKSPQFQQHRGHFYVMVGGRMEVDLLKLPYGDKHFTYMELIKKLSSEPHEFTVVQEKFVNALNYMCARLILSTALEDDSRYALNDVQLNTVKQRLKDYHRELVAVAKIVETMLSPNYFDSALREYLRCEIKKLGVESDPSALDNIVAEFEKRMM